MLIEEAPTLSRESGPAKLLPGIPTQHQAAIALNCVCEHLCYISIYFVCLLVSESESRSVMSDSLQPHGLYSPWNSPGQKTGVDSLSLLQGIFPTQELNLGLLHYRWILYQLSHMGSPRILEWVAFPFSSRSSQPRNQTRVSCIAGRFFTSWAIREQDVS